MNVQAEILGLLHFPSMGRNFNYQQFDSLMLEFCVKVICDINWVVHAIMNTTRLNQYSYKNYVITNVRYRYCGLVTPAFSFITGCYNSLLKL